MLFQIFIRSMIPFVILMTIAGFLYYDGQMENARGTFTAGIIFTIVGGESVIYDLNHISLLKRSMIHFAVMLVTIYPILLLSGWFSLDTFSDYLIIFGLFLMTGAVLWSIMLLAVKIFEKKRRDNRKEEKIK